MSTRTRRPGSRPSWPRRALAAVLVAAGACLIVGLVLFQLATSGTPPPHPQGWYRPTWEDVSTSQILGALLTWVLFPAFLLRGLVLAPITYYRSR